MVDLQHHQLQQHQQQAHYSTNYRYMDSFAKTPHTHGSTITYYQQSEYPPAYGFNQESQHNSSSHVSSAYDYYSNGGYENTFHTRTLANPSYWVTDPHFSQQHSSYPTFTTSSNVNTTHL